MLCVLDGWGYRADPADNAVAQANTPVWDRLVAKGGTAFLKTSGRDVGLPDGQMGNSEVGHMNLGAGRVVMQDLPRIDAAIEDGDIAGTTAFVAMVTALEAVKGTCHLIGLLSPGGVHSHERHIVALARILDAAGIPVRVHAFMDGRDTPPQSGRDDLSRFARAIEDCRDVRIATVTGRYFAMDRDKRWERVAAAYAAMVRGEGQKAATPDQAIADAYERGETDEFVTATVIDGYQGMADGDGLLSANFRADRMRQLLTALVDPDFDGFDRGNPIEFAATAGMVEYSSTLAGLIPALFPPVDLKDGFGEVVSAAGLTQLRIAETEKYPHVTFFFNGGAEAELPGEERIMVPSPKVATYDLQPEMSAPEVTRNLVDAIRSNRFDAVIANFANPDMVGHTGSLEAAIRAVETVDGCLGEVVEAIEAAGGALFVTADHGNCEQMRDPETGGPHTAHTKTPVRAVLVGVPGFRLTDGRLADVAPTLLALMGLSQPAAMTGHSLLAREERDDAAD